MVSAWPERPNVKLVGVHDGMEAFALITTETERWRSAVNVWRISPARLRGGTRAASIKSWLCMEELPQRHGSSDLVAGRK